MYTFISAFLLGPPLFFLFLFFCLSVSLLFCCSQFFTEWHHFIYLDVYSEKSKRKWIASNAHQLNVNSIRKNMDNLEN